MTSAYIRALVGACLAANREGGREAVEELLAGYKCAGKPTRIEPNVRGRIERSLVAQELGWVGGRAKSEAKRRSSRRNAKKATAAAKIRRQGRGR